MSPGTNVTASARGEMSEPEIPYRSIRELGRANRTGETGPVALTTLLLDRIADLNPGFHALAAAKAAEAQLNGLGICWRGMDANIQSLD